MQWFSYATDFYIIANKSDYTVSKIYYKNSTKASILLYFLLGKTLQFTEGKKPIQTYYS